MNSDIEYRGPDAEEFAQIKGMIQAAVTLFVDALPGMEAENKLSFKALMLEMEYTEAEGEAISDIITTLMASELVKLAPKEGFKYDCSVEKLENEIVVWIHAKHSSEEDEETSSVSAVAEETQEVLLEASGIGHVDPENHVNFIV